MKFSQYQYERPNMDAMQQEMDSLLQKFRAATSVHVQNEIIASVNQLRQQFDTMANIAYIRYSTDTTNKAYETEQGFFDTNSPIYQGMGNQFYKALVNSKYRNELQQQWGKQLFDIAQVTLETFTPDIIAALQHENQLGSEYTKLRASAKVMFQGEERNLAGLVPFQMSKDREVRKAAQAARWGFFAEKSAEFDRIFDEQVKTRHDIATRLGFKNFVPLGYKRMLRTDYDAQMVAGYRQQVKDVIVPLASELRTRQAQRLGLGGDFKFYDTDVSFKSGNPTPKGGYQKTITNGQQMYRELSPKTDEFFNFMVNNELMDLVNRKGKAGGGYCTYIANYKAPFIFSNFNGTADDVRVLTHEAGHAFQVYMSRHFEMPEYHWPTYEACEIHSMSMEFLTWPWMKLFFNGDTEKFKFEHLSGALLFLPYGVSIDEFQHGVYENPNYTPTQRKQLWRNIEQKYMPWIDYDGNAFLEGGGFWQKQSHIFQMPFYYIDYTLAQICAFQFWHKANTNREQALSDYIKLCEVGGSRPFLELVKYANLRSPFADDCLEQVVAPVKQYLANVNDSQF